MRQLWCLVGMHIKQEATDIGTQETLAKWQKTIDLMAGVFNALARFIVQAQQDGDLYWSPIVMKRTLIQPVVLFHSTPIFFVKKWC